MSVLDDDESRVYQATYGDAKTGDEEQDDGEEHSPPPAQPPQPGECDDLLALFMSLPSKK